MIYDLTADILERAMKTLLESKAEVIIPSDMEEIPDDYEGYLIQVRHTANIATDNNGEIPVIATYEVEVTRRVFAGGLEARKTESGASIKAMLKSLKDAVEKALEGGIRFDLISAIIQNEEIATTESKAHLFTSTIEVTCQPVLIEE